MRKRFGGLRAILLFASMAVITAATGCGKSEYKLDSNSIVINEDHTVHTYIVEEFDSSVYSEEELVAFVGAEAQAYNSSHSGVVTIGSHEVQNGKIIYNIDYSTIQACNDNMQGVLFIGTVGDAIDAGIDMNVSLYIVGKEISTIGKYDLQEMRDEKLIIVYDKYTIRCPGKIKYYSQWMDMVDDYTVKPFDDKGKIYYVIYE